MGLAVIVGFIYVKVDAQKRRASGGTTQAKSLPAQAAPTAVTQTGKTQITAQEPIKMAPAPAQATPTAIQTQPRATTTSSTRRSTTKAPAAKPGFAAVRTAPILNQTGLASQLYAGLQTTVGDLLGKLRARNPKANFAVALNRNNQLIEGDPSGAIANSASVSFVGALTKKLATAGTNAPTLESVVQSNLGTMVTLYAAPTVINKLFATGKLDANSQDQYGKILLCFVINNVWYFIADPFPPSIVVGKAYPAYDIIERW